MIVRSKTSFSNVSLGFLRSLASNVSLTGLTVLVSTRRGFASRTDKGWIVGNVKSGFQLTPAGKIIANQVARQLEGATRSKKPVSASTRSREAAAVKYIQETAAFQRWLSNRNDFVMQFPEFVTVMNATLETPRRVLRQNLHFYKESARVVSANTVRSFLEACENIFMDSLREQ